MIQYINENKKKNSLIPIVCKIAVAYLFMEVTQTYCIRFSTNYCTLKFPHKLTVTVYCMSFPSMLSIIEIQYEYYTNSTFQKNL